MTSRTSLLAARAFVHIYTSCATPIARDQDPDATTTESGPQKGDATKVSSSDGDSALRQANNPLADMKALNFHDFYAPDVSGTQLLGQ